MKDKTLENFMKENFPYREFKQAKIFTKEMRGDYQAQAKRICEILDFKTVFEYRAKELRCHLSYAGQRPLHVDENGDLKEEPFITVFPSLYE